MGLSPGALVPRGRRDAEEGKKLLPPAKPVLSLPGGVGILSSSPAGCWSLSTALPSLTSGFPVQPFKSLSPPFSKVLAVNI